MKIKNKWLVLLGAVAAQMSIGALYSWSIFNAPFAEVFGVEKNAIYQTYAIAIFFFAFATLLSGRIQIKKGPRFTALIGGVLYSSGVFLSAFATSPVMLYITYGVIAGSGVGFVYVVPLATLVKWFPKNKGAITGLAVSAFAIGGLVFKKVATAILGDAAVTQEILSSTFMTLGTIYAVLTLLGGYCLVNPENFEAKAAGGSDDDLTPKQVVKTVAFYQVLLSYFFAVMPGLLIIGLAKDIGIELVSLTPVVAGGIVGLLALVNAGGRLASGILSDKLGGQNVLKGMYVLTIVSLAILSFVPLNLPLFYLAMIGVVVGYGSFLAVFPGIISSQFGAKYYSANYGLVFQGYGIAGLVGPIIKNNTTSFEQTFLVAMVAAIVGCIILFSLKKKEA